MSTHRTHALFGGALFAAGLAADHAGAQTFEVAYHQVSLTASGTPSLIDNGPGFWGPLTLTGTTCTAYSYGGPTDIIVQAWCTGTPVGNSAAVALAYITVDAPALLELAWDFTGVPDGAPTMAQVFHGTTGALIINENASTVGQPVTGVSGAILEADQLYAILCGLWSEGPTSMFWFTLSPAPCFADCDNNGAVNVDDIDCFVAAFTSGDPNADCDGNGALNVDDIDCFVAIFLDGCP